MSQDLTKGFDKYALFFPSVSSIYAKFVSRPETLMPAHRYEQAVKKFPHGPESLNFLNKDKGAYYNNTALYSFGHAVQDTAKSDIYESMIQKRDRKNTIVMGDSGGYQIASGIIGFDWEDTNSPKSTKLKKTCLDWLEHTADVSMTLDVPTRAIINPKVPVHTFKECLDITLDSYDFFIKNRKPYVPEDPEINPYGAKEGTRLLNIVHGRTNQESNFWYNSVKDFPFEGWSFAGGHVKNWNIVLPRLIEMRDTYMFDKNINGHKRDWIHFLGISRLYSACAFTTLQEILRQQVSESFVISYDCASPFVCAANGLMYTGYKFAQTSEALNNKDSRKCYMVYDMNKGPDHRDLVNSDIPFAWKSPLGLYMTMEDICAIHPDTKLSPEELQQRIRDLEETGDVDGDNFEFLGLDSNSQYINKRQRSRDKTSWDSWSYVLIMNHNVYEHIKGIREAQGLYSLPDFEASRFVPANLREFKEILHKIFTVENTDTELKKYTKLFDELQNDGHSHYEFSDGTKTYFNKPSTFNAYIEIDKHKRKLETITNMRTKGVNANEGSSLFHFEEDSTSQNSIVESSVESNSELVVIED